MSNYLEYKDKVAFHPGYYVKELVEESGLTQEDFAKRLGTTPKNLSCLIRGEQSMSIDIAMKLSRLIGTSIDYWLNLQKVYDVLVAEFKSDEELEKERAVFEEIDYKYFRDNFGLPNAPRRIDEQIENVRRFLDVASLTVLTRPDMAVRFREGARDVIESDTLNANIMAQIATNIARKVEAPKFNKKAFSEAADYALAHKKDQGQFCPEIEDAFLKAGVILVLLPNLAGSKISGASKKVGDNIVLMMSDRRRYAESFWNTLFNEVDNIMNGDYGTSA